MTAIAPYLPLWIAAAIFTAVVIHHIHHDLKGGHRR